MKKNFTKRHKAEVKEIIINFGYWSIEFRNFIEQFEYDTTDRIHTYARYIERYELPN